MNDHTTRSGETVSVEIGRVPIALRTGDASFRQMLETRYAGFINSSAAAQLEFQIDLHDPAELAADADVRVARQGNDWLLERGDFRADWNVQAGRGNVRQSKNPYAIDSVLRIVHTLILAREGGFLMHAASAIRHGQAFLFAGVSGAGKTTISRLAPPDAQLLTDEVSYVRPEQGAYWAYGTPFAGELAKNGENVSAPVKALFLLEKGAENRIEAVEKPKAVRCLLRNTLFFAEDPGLVAAVFEAACAFVERVPVRKLTFLPDARVWELIQ